MCAVYSDIINHQPSLFPELILDALQSQSGVILGENILLPKSTAHVVPLVPSTIGIVHEVVNPVGGGDGTSTSVGAADGIPTHLPHISPPKQLLVLHIC
ncbi:hypothetical protein N7537_006000 [Penicillium hordei]|uniref:Uncharacterized protein n=1 Tax=Penicillium hordei TaxID=40994 RepID=A0AAD6E6P7_9EURO|nr:uncharacterized protein N7537_006000 [Penicillium hordei]KAJ5603044.1 hypothetical protein N7537_006000 [Penicillium hordei]